MGGEIYTLLREHLKTHLRGKADQATMMDEALLIFYSQKWLVYS
jgi:hypothetical protein